MTILHLDFEAFGLKEIKKVGSRSYSEDALIIMAGYALDDNPIKVWVDKSNGEFANADGNEEELIEALANPKVEIWAHNVKFEKDILENAAPEHWPIPNHSRYYCTAALASSVGLPRSLDRAAKALKLKIYKDDKGKYHIRRYCVPCKPTKNHAGTRWYGHEEPQRFMEFIEYCRTDVDVGRALYKLLKKFQYNGTERKVFLLDMAINNRGIPIDKTGVKKCLNLMEQYTARETTKFKSLTNGIAPSQLGKVREWLKQQGCNIPNMQEATVDDYLRDDDTPPIARIALEIVQSLKRTSTKKLVPMLNALSKDGRIHGALKYWGAERTGRFTGEIIQPQNYPRPVIKNTEFVLKGLIDLSLDDLTVIHKDIPTAVSSCLRHLIAAPQGKEFLVADYSSIEARGVCWLAEQEDALELFRVGKDTYIDMAAYIFGVRDDRVNEEQRWVGKQVILGAGYGLGHESFQKYCAQRGVSIKLNLCRAAIDGYRAKYNKVVNFWKELEKEAKRAILTGEVTEVGPYIKFGMVGPFLMMRLPSGRLLSHPYARVADVTVTYKENEWETKTIEFMGKTKSGKPWEKIRTYGGSLAESATQGVARDFLANGMLNAESHGYPIIMTVHDEIVSEVNEGYGDVKLFEEIICYPPLWGKGMPLEAKGYRARRYRK